MGIAGLLCQPDIYYLFPVKLFRFPQRGQGQPPESRHWLPARNQGFHYQGSRDGLKIISIKSDRFSIQKKKVGFFRFGLLNEIRLDNALIHIYGSVRPAQNAADRPQASNLGERSPAFKNAGDKSPLKEAPKKAGADHAKPRRVLTFNNLFTKESLPGFPIKRISAVVMEPVRMVLHDEQSVVTRISASSAVMRLNQRGILFKGAVRVESGFRVLNTDRLRFIPKAVLMKIDRQWVLKTPEKQQEGHRLTTDVFLRSVAS